MKCMKCGNEVINGYCEQCGLEISSEKTNIVRRGYIALKDKDYTKAVEFFERALDENPEDSWAYYGLFLTDFKVCDTDELIDLLLKQFNNKKIKKNAIDVDEHKKHIDEICKKYSNTKYFSSEEIREMYKYDFSYESFPDTMNYSIIDFVNRVVNNIYYIHTKEFSNNGTQMEIDKIEKSYLTVIVQKVEEENKKEIETKEKIRLEYNDFIAVNDKKCEDYYNDSVLLNLESDYCNAMKEFEEKNYYSAMNSFKDLGNYKESTQYYKKAQESLSAINNSSGKTNKAINCPACKKFISVNKGKCPHCGYELNKFDINSQRNSKQSNTSGTIILIALIIFLVLSLGSCLGSCGGSSSGGSSSGSGVSEEQMNDLGYYKENGKWNYEGGDAGQNDGITGD